MNRALLNEQDWEYYETLRMDKEKEEEFLREAYAVPIEVPKEVVKELPKEVVKEVPKEVPKELPKEVHIEDYKLTINELRNARVKFYEKKIDLNK